MSRHGLFRNRHDAAETSRRVCADGFRCMAGRRRVRGAALLAVVLGLALPLVASAAHRDVWLKNARGEKITPSSHNAEPYSPRMTCGLCHGYGIITTGYHFQQGFDVMSDRHAPRRPWQLSPGMYGKWEPFAAAGRLAAKVNGDGKHVDLSAYDWIGGADGSPPCGGCHPGGGGMEYGRDRRGRADPTLTLADAESLSTSALDGDFSSRAAPDGRSHFRESGVVEADCLICHQPGYEMAARNRQLAARNYRWAATAGAGLGRIEGAVFTPRGKDDGRGVWNFSRPPRVTYHWSDRRIFTADGRLRGARVGAGVAAGNCLFCHGPAEAKGMGALFTPAADAHAKAGMRCTDCHGLVGKTPRERLRHQIAKGFSAHNTVRDDLDGTAMKFCTDCHGGGRYQPARSGLPRRAGDPRATHANRFPGVSFHTYLIACTGCHATAQPAKGLLVLDLTTGREIGFTADDVGAAAEDGAYARPAKAAWPPWITPAKSGGEKVERYTPYVPKHLLWFGERMKNGEVRPIPLHHVRAAAAGLYRGKAATGGTGTRGGRETAVVADGDVLTMLDLLARRGFSHVVYVADRVYERKGERLVPGDPADAAGFDAYRVVHGVAPRTGKTPYGAAGNPQGCLACHDEKGAFFTKMRIGDVRGFLRDDYPVLKEPHAAPQMEDWGLSSVPSHE